MMEMKHLGTKLFKTYKIAIVTLTITNSLLLTSITNFKLPASLTIINLPDISS